MRLSSGVILEILNGANPEKPVFQVINAKKIESTNSVDRYRLLLSDGEYVYSHVMLAAQLNKIMENNGVPNLSVIEVNKYLCNKLQGQEEKRVIILLDFKVLAPGSKVGERLGNPTQLNPSSIPTSKAKPAIKSEMSDQKAAVFKPQENNNTAISTGNTMALHGVPPVKKALTPGTPNSRVHSIASLTPYQNRWRIRARVTMKSNIRTWSNSKGEGKLFSCNLLDDSGEIRMTGFREQVDKFYDMLELNKVYYISRCTLKTANKQYSNVNNDYEMTMNSETLIEPCNDDSDLPVMSFDFVKLSELEQCKPPSTVDVIGVVKVCNDVTTVTGRQSQKEIMKRDLQIVDQSGLAVVLTLWGEEANKFDGYGFPIVAVKGARLSDFNGRSLSVSGSSQLIVNPDSKEAHVLRGWFESGGRDQSFSTYQSEGGSSGGQSSNWKTFLQVKSENLGQGEKADYYTAKGTVVFVKKDNCMYQACPTPDCNKKVIDLGNGHYRCEKCNREFPNHKWRMILSCNVADHTDNQWITCFQDSAECVLGLKADELGQLRENDEMRFDQVLQDALFKSYIFRMRAKVETYNDESRLKTVCVAANAVDWKEYGHQLLDQISQLGV